MTEMVEAVDRGSDAPLSVMALLQVARQVAAGMEHLAAQVTDK